MTLTIVPNTFCLERRDKKSFELSHNKLHFLFSFQIAPSHIVFTAKVIQLKKTFRINFGADFLAPFLIFDFIHHPSKFECEIVDNSIKVLPKSPFSSLENPRSIVQPRIERELAQIHSPFTRENIRRLIIQKFFFKENPLSETDELEVIPLLNILTVPQMKVIFFKLKRYDACTAFIKKIIYEFKDLLSDEFIEIHFKRHSSIANLPKLEYTTTCLEVFILRGNPIPWTLTGLVNADDLDYYFSSKYLEYLTTNPNALEVVQAKYAYNTDISVFPVWLQAHLLKEYLAAPKMLEIDKESCLFQLLSIYIDLEMEACPSIKTLQKLIHIRSLLPPRKPFMSDEGTNLSRWILNTIQNLHNNDYWSSSLRQKVVEISEALNLRWQFPDTFREAYFPALYYESKRDALPFHPIVDEMTCEILFHPQIEVFYFPLTVIYNHHIVPLKDVVERFLDSPYKILVLEGGRGSGKTASLFNLSDLLITSYSDSKNFIPYIHLDKDKKHTHLLDPFISAKEILKTIPFLFIFDGINSLDEISYFKDWKEEYPNAKFIFATQKTLVFQEKYEICQLLPLRADEASRFYEGMNKEKPLRYPSDVYLKALKHIANPTPFHMHLLTKLISRKLHPDNPNFHEKVNEAIHCLEEDWDKIKGPGEVNTISPPSLQPIIKWFKKLNR